MTLWDGIRTKEREKITVLGATNRPFDLDEAVLRRFQKRILVDLPNEIQRSKILKLLLLKENYDLNDFDLTKIAQLTDGFSGSDLKHVCISAAFNPIRNFLQNEKKFSLLPLQNRFFILLLYFFNFY